MLFSVVIVLTGANRSGTSFAANLLLELGCDLGPADRLLGPDYRNERGYFENKEILAANLSLLLGPWIDPALWVDDIEGRRTIPWLTRLLMVAAKAQYFSGGRRTLSRRAAARRDTLKQLAARYSGVLVNDARFSSTLSAWRQDASIERVLYIYRHPAHVARSMKAAYGLPIGLGYLFWCQRVREFLRQAEGLPVVIVQYDRFFDPEGCQSEMERLSHFLGRSFDARQLMQALVKVRGPELRHWDEGHSTEASGRAMDVYALLNRYHRQYSTLSPLVPSADLLAPR